MFLICKVKTADAYAGDNACTEWVDVLKLCACVINSLESCGDCKLSEAVHSLCFLLVKALFGRKVVDGGSDLYIKILAGDVVYIGKPSLLALILFQNSSTVLPRGETIPIPVTTTLFI